MLRICQRVLTGNVEFIKFDVVQKHIDAAQVVRCDVDFLSKEAVAHGIPSQHLFCLQQQRTGTAGRVIYLVDFLLAYGTQPGQQFRHISRRKELTAGLARIAGVHGHQVFVGIAKGINVMLFHIAKVHICHAVQQFHELLIALGNSRTQLIAVDIVIIEQPCKLPLGGAALCGFLNVSEDCFQRFVEVFIAGRFCSYIAEQLTGQDEEPFFLYQPFPCLLCLCIRHILIAEVRVACINFALIDIAGNVLRNITVEHRTENVALEIPSVHCAAQIIRYRPDCTVQFFAFLLFFGVYHFYFLHQMRISALFSFILT